MSKVLLCVMSASTIFLTPYGSVVKAASDTEGEGGSQGRETAGFFDDDFQEDEDFSDSGDVFTDDRLVDAVARGDYRLVRSLVEDEYVREVVDYLAFYAGISLLRGEDMISEFDLAICRGD